MDANVSLLKHTFEMWISKALLTGVEFTQNNIKIWNMIYQVTHETEAWGIVKGFKARANSRRAYNAPIKHYR